MRREDGGRISVRLEISPLSNSIGPFVGRCIVCGDAAGEISPARKSLSLPLFSSSAGLLSFALKSLRQEANAAARPPPPPASATAGYCIPSSFLA